MLTLSNNSSSSAAALNASCSVAGCPGRRCVARIGRGLVAVLAYLLNALISGGLPSSSSSSSSPSSELLRSKRNNPQCSFMYCPFVVPGGDGTKRLLRACLKLLLRRACNTSSSSTLLHSGRGAGGVRTPRNARSRGQRTVHPNQSMKT